MGTLVFKLTVASWDEKLEVARIHHAKRNTSSSKRELVKLKQKKFIKVTKMKVHQGKKEA